MIESKATELKREFTKDIVKELIAFLNTKGGQLYIGIAYDGEVIGVSDMDLTMTQIANCINDSIRPDAKVFIRIEVLEDQIICINVMEGNNKPYYIQGKGLRPEGVYVRLGTSSVRSSDQAIKRMLLDSINVGFEDLVSSNQSLTFKTCKKMFLENKMTFSEVDFFGLSMVNQERQFTNLAYILSDQSEHSVKIAVFSGEDELRFLDRRGYKGSIFSVLDQTLEYLDLNNHLNAHVKNYYREESYDYNQEDIREGLLNALIHRDYSLGASIMIKIYNDRIEILSIGGLVYGLHLDDIASGISKSRNPNLSNIFYRLKLVEAYGIGLKKLSVPTQTMILKT